VGRRRATIVPLTDALDQAFERLAAGPAVAPRAAAALDLVHGAGARGDDGVDGVIGDATAETEDHGRAFREPSDDLFIRAAFRSPLGW
jgi:hypothetical protein